MKDFPSLRKELYLQSFNRHVREEESSVEPLFEYIVNDNEKAADGMRFSSVKIDDALFAANPELTISVKNALPSLQDLVREMNESLPFLNREGIVLFQFLFYGDPDHSGAGDSGGLATLLRDLGSAISEKPAMSGVITVCAYDTSQSLFPFVPLRFPGENHGLVHLPMDLGGSGSEGYLPYHSLIERVLTSFLDELAMEKRPGKPLFHIRYLDAASLAISRVAMERSIPYALTLTPDPHRKISENKRNTTSTTNKEESLHHFYRVLMGDLLIDHASAIVGIGKDSINTSLIPYFPQLSDKEDLILQGIDEGIQIITDAEDVVLDDVFCNEDCALRIEESLAGRPVILNVGRLNPAKGQMNLLTAWDQSGIWETYNLFFIGGDFVHPSPTEKGIIDFVHNYVKHRPYLKGKLRFQPSTKNSEIRALQQTLGKRDVNEYPDIYLCSSLKEEFGISVIEAMSAGMVVFAPMLGGAKEYMRHGINGFMINTGSGKSMGKEFSSYGNKLRGDREKIRAIKKNAKETIKQMYSLEKIAEEFVHLYTRMGERHD